MAIASTPAQEIQEFASADDVAIRVLYTNGDVRRADRQARRPSDRPEPGLRDISDYRVASRVIYRPVEDDPIAYVQYAKSKDSLTATIARLRVFLGLGVLGGGALALLAGLAVARRAIEPIAGLTATARRVAKTRDPEVDLPRLRADDEIADLSRTLDDMLGELAEAHTETEGALARQRQFVADASHELRTPLTSILANLELLEAALEGEDREIAGSALRSSQRMRRLVADLLLLARADAGRQAPREPVDMATVVREAAGEVATLAERHDLEVDVGDEPVVVEGSADDLHRLVLNLIQNALVHTPPGLASACGCAPRTARYSRSRTTARAFQRSCATALVRALRPRPRRHGRRQRPGPGDRSRGGRDARRLGRARPACRRRRLLRREAAARPRSREPDASYAIRRGAGCPAELTAAV